MKKRISPSWVVGLVLVASAPIIGAQGADKSSSAATPSQAPAASQAKPYQSPWFTELGKLARAGIEDRVIMAFVDSAGTFNLGPDQIVQLRDLGVSGDLISAVLQHDSEIALGLRVVPASTVPESSSGLKTLLAAAPTAAPAHPRAAEPAAKAAAAEPTTPPAVVADGGPSNLPQQSVCVAESAPAPVAACQGKQTSAGQPELSPVRKPYAEQLTNPIIMVRAAGRMPNLVVIEGLADSDSR